MGNDVISVIVPVYNSAKTLDRCIASVLEQSYTKLELILVNDGSSDGSKEICDGYASRDERVKVFHKQNEGAGSARNMGIMQSMGAYISFLDADDYMDQRMLACLYDRMTHGNHDLVICNNYIFDEAGSVRLAHEIESCYEILGQSSVRSSYLNLINQGLAGVTWNKLYRADIIKDNDIQFPDLRRCQDWIFNYEYFDYVHQYGVINDALYYYLENSTSTTWSKLPQNYFEIVSFVHTAQINLLAKWGVLDDKTQEILATKFLGAVRECIFNGYNPTWNMTNKERKEYITSIVDDNLTVQRVSLAADKGRYARAMNDCILKKNILGIRALVKCNILLRTYGAGIFRYLKI